MYGHKVSKTLILKYLFCIFIVWKLQEYNDANNYLEIKAINESILIAEIYDDIKL